MSKTQKTIVAVAVILISGLLIFIGGMIAKRSLPTQSNNGMVVSQCQLKTTK